MTQPKIGEFCWTELGTSDVKKAKDFYSKVFGWNFKDMNVGGMTYTLIENQGKEFGGMYEIPHELKDQMPSHWLTYVLVDEINNALQKAKQQGAKVIKDVTQAGDMGRLAIILDPNGAHIALWEMLKQK